MLQTIQIPINRYFDGHYSYIYYNNTDFVDGLCNN